MLESEVQIKLRLEVQEEWRNLDSPLELEISWQLVVDVDTYT